LNARLGVISKNENVFRGLFRKIHKYAGIIEVISLSF
jgi:hypothetical protein